MFARALSSEFAREVRIGLTTSGQKSLPCRFLYDELGSALFEAITLLPEYGLTRADARVIRAHAAEVPEKVAGRIVTAELGSGSGVKTRAVLEEIARRQKTVYYPIDVSAGALERCAVELAGVATVIPQHAGYLEGLQEVACRRSAGETLLVLFLGSTIGNFEPDAAVDFLYAVRLCLRPGDALLLGTDLVKPAKQLIEAYDDAAGVTAAFNRNLLARINRELEGDFDLRRFEHLVRYDRSAARVEMHLRATERQTVNVARAGLRVEFEPGETIFTESCYKFRPEQVRQMAHAAGFRPEAQWFDNEWPFAESLLLAA